MAESILLTIAIAGEAEAGQLLWGAPEWFVPAAIIVAVLTLLVIWSYAHRDGFVTVRAIAGLLKIAAILLLAICLLQPLRSGTRPRPKANILPILVDNSQSMRLKPSGSEQTRRQRAAALLGDEMPWRIRMGQAFDVRTYAFDARLSSIDNASELPMDGYVSSLFGGLQSLAERFSDRPVGAVMLFTDGNMTDPPAADFDWSKLGFPVYPVLPAVEEEVNDLRIANVSMRQTDFESAPLTIRVSVESVAMESQKAIIQICDATTRKVVEEQTITTGESGDVNEVRFQFRPESSGVQFYYVNLFCEADRKWFDDPDQPLSQAKSSEATLINNRRILAVNRASGPYRLLYVAGRPNWEYKFIRRALEEDAEVQLVGLLRIANKEPKFSFRDRGVSATNPLFAGLGEDAEDAAAQYDEPVILRLGVKESEELSDGFPDSSEELFAYHGVILDDIDPEFFTQDQMLLLRRFVGTRGGGLLMLGGQETFAGERFSETPLGELAPVYSARGMQQGRSGAFRFSLTREGMLQPWIRLRDNEKAEQERIQSMPTFNTLNSVGDVKPGASQLATVALADGQTAPALVAQRFGKGRTAAIPVADVWRWSMRRDDRDRDDPAQAWRQLTHWLVNEVSKRVELQIEQSDDPSQPVTIVVTARDEAYLPMDNATVELEISPLGGEPFKIIAQADDSMAGVYTATYYSRQPRGYHVNASVNAVDGSHVGTASGGWTAQPDAAEFRDLRLNRKLLEHIASQTGGEIIRDDRLEQFADDLPNRKVPVSENWVYPIWHHPWVMLTAILCLCFEWGLRRWKGLA